MKHSYLAVTLILVVICSQSTTVASVPVLGKLNKKRSAHPVTIVVTADDILTKWQSNTPPSPGSTLGETLGERVLTVSSFDEAWLGSLSILAQAGPLMYVSKESGMVVSAVPFHATCNHGTSTVATTMDAVPLVYRFTQGTTGLKVTAEWPVSLFNNLSVGDCVGLRRRK
jgi:hypothetical protein